MNTTKYQNKQINKIIKLRDSGKFKNAEKEALQLLKKDSKNIYAMKILIEIYNTISENEKVKPLCLKLLKLENDKRGTYLSLGNYYLYNNEMQLAKETYLKGIELYPDYIDLLYQYGVFSLICKEYQDGLNYYRYRYHKGRTGRASKLKFENGLLEKDSEIKGKTIFLYDDQGYGDMIQFMRFIPLLEEKGAKVQVQVHKLLHRIFQQTFPNAIISSNNISVDYHAPLLDIAYFLNVNYENIPFSKDYLKVNLDEVQKINKQYFLQNQKPKVGIVWRSNSEDSNISGKKFLREKGSSSLEDFLKYFNRESIDLYSIQYGVNEEEKELLAKNNILSLGDNFVDFYDNALFIKNLDIVVGIETASLLIAGALGKESIVLLQKRPYWIWGLEGSKTNWFPSLTLVRQSIENQWNEVFDKAIPILDGKISTVYLKKGIELHHLNRLSDAETMYRKALELNEYNADAYHFLGIIAYVSGHVEHAVGLIKKALEINPTLEEAVKNLNNILNKIKQK